jgi:hypothetical protein
MAAPVPEIMNHTRRKVKMEHWYHDYYLTEITYVWVRETAISVHIIVLQFLKSLHKLMEQYSGDGGFIRLRNVTIVC